MAGSLLGYQVEEGVVVKPHTNVGGGTVVLPITVMAGMAMPQWPAHAELKFSATKMDAFHHDISENKSVSG
jgi:hypothetical protein